MDTNETPGQEQEFAADTEGLSARLEAFVNSGGGEENNSPEPLNANTGDDPPKKEEQPSSGDEEEEDEFPDLGKKPEAKDDSFDESKFDKETDAATKGMDDNQARRFKELRNDLKEHKRQLAEAKKATAQTQVPKEVEAELVTLREKAKEAEALRQRNEELLRANDQIAIQESPEFVNGVKKPLAEMKEVLEQIAGSVNVDPKTLAAIIEEPDIIKQDKMIDQLSDRLGIRTANRISRLADDFKAIQALEDDLMKNASTKLEESRVRSHSEMEKQNNTKRETYKVAVNESFENYAKRIPSFVDSTGNLTDLAQAVMAKTESIDPLDLTPSDLGYMAFAANALPEARKTIVALTKEIAILKGSRKPSGGISSGQSAPSSEPSGDDGEGLVDRMRGKEFTFTAPQ